MKTIEIETKRINWIVVLEKKNALIKSFIIIFTSDNWLYANAQFDKNNIEIKNS